MNKKGLTLVELLAAIIIFGLAISLTATVITLINNASSKIEVNAKANSVALFIDRDLKDDILSFGPTTYSSCGGQNCYVLEKEFEYTFDSGSGQIVLTTYNPALTYQIQINNGELLINGIPMVIDYFSLGSNSNIELITTGSQAYLKITYELIAPTGEIFTFTTSYSFAVLTIPA